MAIAEACSGWADRTIARRHHIGNRHSECATICVLKPSHGGQPLDLLREADAAQKVGEAWVGEQWVEEGGDFHVEKSVVALLIGFLQKGEGLILFPQSRVDACEIGPRDIP